MRTMLVTMVTMMTRVDLSVLLVIMWIAVLGVDFTFSDEESED